MDLSIVILNYKQTGMVKQCVKGILASQPQLAYEIIVVDNNSGDNCLTEIKKLFAPAEELPVTTSSLLVKLEAPKPPLLTIQAKENGGVALGTDIGRAVHAHHTFERKQIVKKCKNRFFDFTGILGTPDDDDLFGKIGNNKNFRIGTVDRRIRLKIGN